MIGWSKDREVVTFLSPNSQRPSLAITLTFWGWVGVFEGVGWGEWAGGGGGGGSRPWGVGLCVGGVVCVGAGMWGRDITYALFDVRMCNVRCFSLITRHLYFLRQGLSLNLQFTSATKLIGWMDR